MRTFKQWLYDRFLPQYCADALREENGRLLGRVVELKQENARLQAYIDGTHDALRLLRRVQDTHRREGGA